jgi:hypothetical protein
MMKPLFLRLDPSNSEKVDLFASCSNSETLVHCYKNFIEIGCKYQPEISLKIEEVLESVEARDPPEWWVTLLD